MTEQIGMPEIKGDHPTQNLVHAEICASMKKRIADMLELVIFDTLKSVLDELLERQNQAPHVICHKSECSEREREPF